MKVVNPVTGERIDEIEEDGREAVDASLASAVRAFRLGASLWPTPERGARLAHRIEAGCVYVIELKSDPRIPFGGVKESGYGRGLAEAGIEEFVNRKAVWVQAHGEHDVVMVE